MVADKNYIGLFQLIVGITSQKRVYVNGGGNTAFVLPSYAYDQSALSIDEEIRK